MAGKLTVEDVRRQIQTIALDSDVEVAHGEEDELHFEFFDQLVAGLLTYEEAREIAEVFASNRWMVRWYA